MVSDFRLAFRHLTKSPGFTFVAVLTLALCIGANSAIFSVINAVLLRPFPFPESKQLVFVNNSYPKNDLLKAGVSIPDYLDRMARAPSIEDGAIYSWENFNLSSEAQPERVLGLIASPSLFSTLRIAPFLGRTFSAAEATVGNDKVVVLSYVLWRDTFGSRPGILDDMIRLSGVPYRVVGVMPPEFEFPAPWVKLWVPFAFTEAQKGFDERGNEFSEMIVRLKPGASAAGLSAECDAIVQQNLMHAEQFRPYVEASGFTGIATPMLEETVGEIRPLLWLLQVGVLAALLIGCTNVANLLLTRALGRDRELAIRTALGASRWSIIRQLLAETLLLFALGAALGLLVAMWGLSGMEALGVGNLPRGEKVSLDVSVFIFTLLSASITGLAFGLIPALQASRADGNEVLKGAGTRTMGRRQRTLRHVLVVVEIALSLMLLATTVLLVRSFRHLESQSPGFDASAVATARLTLSDYAYPDDSARSAFVETLTQKLETLPGVEHAAVTSVIPFGYGNAQGTYFISGREQPAGTAPPHGQIRSVSPGFFKSLEIPLQQGRTFTAFDRANAAPVVIIDRVLAGRYWPGQNPVGQSIYRDRDNAETAATIVGVVAAIKQQGLDDPVRKETIYYPYAQRSVQGLTITVRTSLSPESAIPLIRQSVVSIDADLPIYDVRTLDGRIQESLLNRRTPMLLLALFSGMALLLAALGIYGVLAFNVNQRRQEIGIRMALGAASQDVLSLILNQGIRLVGLGVVLGVLGYIAISRFLKSMVFEITPLDPLAIIGSALALTVISLLACVIPARRASKVSPMVALRDE
jgi:putative ABC transport system permease protein